jgi:hypothetical protein
VVLLLTFFMPREAGAQNRYYLPQVADGRFGDVIFRTTFILFNNSNTAVTAVLSLTDDAGNPLITTLGGLGTGSQFNINLDGGVTGFLQTAGSGTGTVGAATVTTTAPIGVSAIFTVYDLSRKYVTESGVGSSDPAAQFVLPVDSTGSFLTGVALFNPGADASIKMTLRNTDGSEAATTTRDLRSGNHVAVFVAAPGQLFPTVTDFRGTMLVQSTSPVSAMVLRQYQALSVLSYTSLPVVPPSSARQSLNLAQVANGSYGSISFETSFLIFNVSPNSANVTLSLTQDNGSPFTVTIPGSGPGTGTDSRFSFTLGAGASIFLQTDGQGAGTSGAAAIASNVPVGASAIFTVLDSKGQFQTEAGVGDSPVLASFTLPVDVTGNFDTGVAFFNPAGNSAALTLRLLGSNGVFVASAPLTLPARNHLATFVDNLFGVGTGFRGSLAITASVGIAATTLRQYASGATYTTLPTAPGVASGKTQRAVYLSRTDTGIAAITGDPDVSWSVTLPDGSLISGTVGGAGQGIQVAAVDGGNHVFVSQVDPLTGNYLMVVPPGTYRLTACYQTTLVPNTSSAIVSYADPDPVQVTVGGEVRDFTLPPVALSDVSGGASGLDSLPQGSAASIAFSSSDRKVQGQFALDGSGNYSGLLPAGSYLASVSSGSAQYYNLGSLTVGGGPATGSFAIPATATLSGTISGGGLEGIPPGTPVTATDTSAPAAKGFACGDLAAVSSATPDPAGQYSMALVQNRSYTVMATIPFTPGGGLTGAIDYPIASNVLSLTGNKTFDIAVPSLRQNVQFYGHVKASSGNPIPDVTVTAYSESLTGAPNVGYSLSSKTDIYGNYSILVPGGTNYRLTFVPPSPIP